MYSDALNKAKEGKSILQKADEKWKNEMKLDADAYEMAIIDFDAAIPGLSGLDLGYALMLKHWALYQLYTNELLKHEHFDVSNPPGQQQRMKALDCAKKAYEVLKSSNAPPKDISYIEGQIKQMS